MYRSRGSKTGLGRVNGDHQANVTAQCGGSLFPQAKPSILTFGLLAPQDGEPTSTLPATIFPKELPKGEKDGVFSPNCGSLITGLLVRAGGEPQKKAAWLLESVSTSGSF